MQKKKNNISVKESLKQQQYRDSIKKKYAIECGYRILEIPHWRIYNDSFKEMIDNVIQEILNSYKDFS